MRVAFVAEVTDRHPDATAEHGSRIGALAELLADSGHEVATFCSKWWSGDGIVKTADGHDYRGVTGSLEENFSMKLPTAVRRWEPDVVHSVHEEPTHVLAANLGGAPLVVDWYDCLETSDVGVWNQVKSRLEQRAAHVPDAVVVPSKLVETNVRELGRPADEIHVIPTGIEFDLISTVEPTETAEIVYSRHLDSAANLSELLLALAEFRDLDWSCAVIGSGPQRAHYEQETREMRISNRVSFLGERSLRERLAIFRGAQVYVHTATRAAFPTDFLRALASGCIGIVSYHEESSAHELIETRDRGYAATSPEEIAGAIEAASDHEHRSIDEAFAEYDENSILDQYLDLYRRL
jgi:hypothetical protein